MRAALAGFLPKFGGNMAARQGSVRENLTCRVSQLERFRLGVPESGRSALMIDGRGAVCKFDVFGIFSDSLLKEAKCPVHIRSTTFCNECNLVPCFEIEDV